MERWEASLRGLKINKASRTLDLVLVAARYKDDGTLAFAKGYERRGAVWSDVRVFDRGTLIKKVKSGAKVYTGDPEKLPGNFEPIQKVRVEGYDGNAYLVANGASSKKDNLSLPIL
jgi:hypothetical protein